MSKKLSIFTGILLAALVTLLLLLIHWGKKSMELRKDLFVDQVNIRVNDVLKQIEQDYYCFDLHAEISLPKLDSFYVANPPGIEGTPNERLTLSYFTPDGEEKFFEKMPLMGPAHMKMLLRFEFDDIPDFRADSTLNDFEKWVRDSYDAFLWTEDGKRLVDTAQFDSLLHLTVAELYPEAEMRYALLLSEKNKVVFSKNLQNYANLQADVEARFFDEESNMPDLTLALEITNKDAMLSDEAWNIYVSGALLTLVSLIIVFLLVRMYLQQKNLLQVQKDFIHGMTHEFNTPLSNIKLISDKLSRNTDEKVTKSAAILEEEATKLQVGMNLILTTALIEKNELSLEKQAVDLTSLLQKTIEKNRTFLNEAGIEIDLRVNGERLQTFGDAFHLENVFQNMINNVKKHSEANVLKVETIRQNGHVIVRFADNGRGVDEEDRERIFAKFESKHPNGAKNGYGLGLYYSRMILNLHGGAIRLLANGERGSIFSIELPA